MTGFTIKVIAITAMFIDHLGYKCARIISDPNIITAMRSVGRIAMPIFMYLIGQGCRYTKNIKKYLLLLLAFAFISEIPFDALVFRPDYITFDKISTLMLSQNVYFTLFLGAFSIYIYELLKEKIGEYRAMLPAFALSYLSFHLAFDYSYMGVLCIFFLYVFREKWQIAITVFLFALATRWESPVEMLAVTSSLIPIFLYNGQRGIKLKYFFYWFYPAHLALISVILYYFYKI